MSTAIVRYVGLDVHKRLVEACIVDQAGMVVHRERFALNRRTLELFATKILRPTDHVALEATTNCWAVVNALRPHVARVMVSNPMATKAIAQAKVKTDKVDAHVLAQLLRCDFLPEVWQPDEATRRLRELTGRRSTLVGQRTMMRNRIHSVLAMRLIEAPSRLFSGDGLEWLTKAELDPQARLLVDSDLRQSGIPAARDRLVGCRAGPAGSRERCRETADDASRRGRGYCRSPAGRLGRPDAVSRRRHGDQLPGSGAFHQAIGRTLLPRSDHQARQQPGPLDADPGRPAPRQTPWSAGPLLPSPVPEKEP